MINLTQVRSVIHDGTAHQTGEIIIKRWMDKYNNVVTFSYQTPDKALNNILETFQTELVGLAAFKVVVSRLWNTLPETVKSAKSVASF